MKHVLISSLIAVSLSACGVSNSIETDVFDIIEASEAMKSFQPTPCSKPIEFEGLSLKQKCWEITPAAKNIPVLGEAFLELGLGIQKINETKFEKIKTANSLHIYRLKSGPDCFNYIAFNIEKKSEQSVRFDFAVTREANCGKLSKVYSAED